MLKYQFINTQFIRNIIFKKIKVSWKLIILIIIKIIIMTWPVAFSQCKLGKRLEVFG